MATALLIFDASWYEVLGQVQICTINAKFIVPELFSNPRNASA